MFWTPHDFWVKGADDLKNSSRFNTWLGFDNWSCTTSPDFSDPICRKHDVAYATLQKLVGEHDGNELDLAWNPRNKHLADAVLKADLNKHGCDQRSALASITLCSFGVPTSSIHWFVNHWNNKGWPVTQQDIDDTEIHPRFRLCGIPTLTNVTPTNRNPDFEVSWTYSPGCLSGITVDYYKFCWSYVQFGSRDEPCVYPEGDQTSSTFTRHWASEVTLESVEIRPDDIVYGGLWGFETLLGNKALEDLLDLILSSGGAYYPKQMLNIEF